MGCRGISVLKNAAKITGNNFFSNLF